MTVSFNCNAPRRDLAALALALVCLCSVVLPAKVVADPIVFSKPTDGGFATNLYSLIAPEESRTIKDKLQERQLNAAQVIKPLDGLQPEYGPTPVRRILIPSKDQHGKSDNDKGWAFSLQEELDKKDPTLSEAVKLMDSISSTKPTTGFKSENTAEERYVAKLTEASEAKLKGTGMLAPSENSEDSASRSRDLVSTDQRTGDTAVHALLDSSSSQQGGLSRIFGDDYNGGDNSSGGFVSLSSRNTRMSDFRALLEGRSPTASALDSAPSTASRLGGLNGLSGSSASSPSAGKLGSLSGAASSGWIRPPVAALTPIPSLQPSRSMPAYTPQPALPTSPLRMSGTPAPAFPPRR